MQARVAKMLGCAACCFYMLAWPQRICIVSHLVFIFGLIVMLSQRAFTIMPRRACSAIECLAVCTRSFDFNLSRPMTPAEVAEVERLVNSWVEIASPTTTRVLPLDVSALAGPRPQRQPAILPVCMRA